MVATIYCKKLCSVAPPICKILVLDDYSILRKDYHLASKHILPKRQTFEGYPSTQNEITGRSDKLYFFISYI